MRFSAFVLIFVSLANGLVAQEVSDPGLFGLRGKVISCLYLEEAYDIAGIEVPADVKCDPSRSTLVFNEFIVLQDAYRSDPDATLDLIRRILESGQD